MTTEVMVRPIGHVRTSAKIEDIELGQAVSEIQIADEFIEALEGVEEFSHLFILYWMHQVKEADLKALKDHPRGRADLPLKGAFATRTVKRPNPIGLTLVELIERREASILVKGLDALDGTPVLDIKPFDRLDFNVRARYPDWWPIVER